MLYARENKKIQIFFLFLIVVFGGGERICSQDKNAYYFYKLDIKNGLSQNTVNCILQDHYGFMWFGTKDGLDRYDGRNFKIFKKDGFVKGLGNNFITSLYEDRSGLIWVGTDAGLFVYYPEKEKFERFPLTDGQGHLIEQTVTQIDGRGADVYIAVENYGLFRYNLNSRKLINTRFDKKLGNLAAFALDKKGNYWLSFYLGGLYFSNDRLKTIRPYRDHNGKNPFLNDLISKIYFEGNTAFISSQKTGFWKLDLSKQDVEKIKFADSPNPLFIRTFIKNTKNEFWIGTESGLYVYHTNSRKWDHFVHLLFDNYSISDNAIYSLYKDREGGVWIGSYFGGINYYPPQYTYFNKYYPSGKEGILGGLRIREICGGSNGNLWIATEDHGLYSFHPSTGKFDYFSQSKNFSNIQTLCQDGDELWIGCFSKGLRVYNTRTGVMRTYLAGNSNRTINSNFVFSIYKTKSGEIFVGTQLGLLSYDRASGAFNRIPELDGSFAYDIKDDSQNNLWIATYASGVFFYSRIENKWYHFIHTDAPGSFPYNKVTSISRDGRGNMWFTTQGGGFCEYNKDKKSFTSYNSKDGMPSEVVFQIVEDDKDYFWLSTDNGLVRFNPYTKSIKVFTVYNGLLSNQFNYKSSYKSPSGEIYFGSIEGLVSFNPDRFTTNKYVPPIYITDFLLFNKPVEVGAKNSPLKKSITFSDKIVLKHNQNTFSFRISSLSFINSNMNKLLCKMEGADRDWRSVSDNSYINYSNLRFGDYKFLVKGSNNDGVFNPKEKVLYITILPPFYLSKIAVLIYIVLFGLAVYYLFRYLQWINKKKERRRMRIYEQKKEKELYDSKIKFFTDIAHEIRTPLTLIKAPLDNVLSKEKIKDTETAENLYVMKKNTERLIFLTNQLLDFRKVEEKGFEIHFTECDVPAVVEEMRKIFYLMAKEENKTFDLSMDCEHFIASVDREAFTKILSNLFSNAIKYSSSFVKINLNTKREDGYFELKVANDGDLLPSSQREEIFKPFVRYGGNKSSLHPGTGIGLSLSRSLAELHGGSLACLSDERYNVFSLVLPVRHKFAFSTQEEHAENPVSRSDTEQLPTKAAKDTILIVEDNREMIDFENKQISPYYSTVLAYDGVQALEILAKERISLVLSDVMMPGMDGIELCKKIKSDINFSHIPVVLLTAKVDLHSKIEGMDTGADAYVEKPFSFEYLLSVITNILRNRKRLFESYSRKPMLGTESIALNQSDQEFLTRLTSVLREKMSNPDLRMDEVAVAMNMSKASFYRKIKGISDMSPNDYLKLERLKYAAGLLKEGNDPINEISYRAGFNSPYYFSKCFHDQFGVLPKDFRSGGK